MARENSSTVLKHKLEVKRHLYLLQQRLLFHYSSFREKLTLRQPLHGSILGELQSFIVYIMLHIFSPLFMINETSNKFLFGKKTTNLIKSFFIYRYNEKICSVYDTKTSLNHYKK